jgi:phosphate uptake regulator
VFKGLFSWWKEDILLKDALEQSALAIDKAGRMFSLGMAVVTDGSGIEKTIFDMDSELNAIQIDIRKKVLEHLAIKPAQDVTSSLILITIIIDIERVGDLAKNLVELYQMNRGTLEQPAYSTDVGTMQEKLEGSFSLVRDAFIDGDDMKANQVMEDCTWISGRCDATLQAIAGDEGLEVREAVAYTLLFRYLKRISGHIRNIASSVVNPFHKLGYKPD